MPKIIITAVILMAVTFTVGCAPEPQEQLLYKPDPTTVAQIERVGYGTPTAAEVDVVEQMALNRSEYRKSLVQLVDFYTNTGNATKLNWVRKELESLTKIPQYRYLMVGETVNASLAASDSIAQADELYKDAYATYRAAGPMLLLADSGKLRQALTKFNNVISTYPTSDKIDDAAYYAARIYEHFKDYEIAVVYYQRAFQWNDSTKYPTRFRAAYLLDHKLHKRSEALTIYRMSLEKDTLSPDNTEHVKQRIQTLTRVERTVKTEVKETKVKTPATPK